MYVIIFITKIADTSNSKLGIKVIIERERNNIIKKSYF